MALVLWHSDSSRAAITHFAIIDEVVSRPSRGVRSNDYCTSDFVFRNPE